MNRRWCTFPCILKNLLYIFYALFSPFQTVLLKGTCKTHVTLTAISLRATLTLSIRPVLYGNFTENLILLFLINILSIPALIYHLKNISPECLDMFHTNSLLRRMLDLLYKEQSLVYVVDKLKGTQSLALLGNLINLYHLEPSESASVLCYPEFTVNCKLFYRILIIL